MQAVEKKKPKQLRRFKVGIVDASSTEWRTIDRILTVTNYRTRGYETVALNRNQLNAKKDIDIILMFCDNPNVINAWNDCCYRDECNPQRPMIFMSRGSHPSAHKYKITSPINPSKLIKLLDQYTITEMNFLPEFEIGANGADMQDIAFSGIKMLRSHGNEHSREDSDRVNALVVDDSLAVRRQMQIEFELLDDHLDLADSAESALRLTESKKYDVVFLDIVMPGVDGYTACKQIKRSKLNRNTPVVMLTSRSSSFDKIKGTLAGCDAYLVKPINHIEFTQAYEKLVVKNSRGKSHGSKQSVGG